MVAYYNEIDPFAAEWIRQLINQNVIAPGDVDERSIVDVQADDIKGYTQCHFFAGIGVWSYALRQAGWPDDLPVWTGSCPCQPFSAAGERKGTDDKRHLWPELHRLIAECNPPVAFGEQVAQKAGAAWFDIVQADLQKEEYAAGMAVFPACGVGAPHQRQRLYWFADAMGNPTDYGRVWGAEANQDNKWQSSALQQGNGATIRDQSSGSSDTINVADPIAEGSQGCFGSGQQGDSARYAKHSQTGQLGNACNDGQQVVSQNDNGQTDMERRRHEAHQLRSGATEHMAQPDLFFRGPVQESRQPQTEECRQPTSDNSGSSAMAHSGSKSSQWDTRTLSGAKVEGSREWEQDGHNAVGYQYGSKDSSLADSDSTRLQGYRGSEQFNDAEGWQKQTGHCAASGNNSNRSETNGFWGSGDWLYCRDEKWRIVEPGTFPLANGTSSRVGKLRGYGNAIVGPQAQAFIESYIEAKIDMQNMSNDK